MPEICIQRTVTADHPALDGHFPGRPLVPAVVLLQQVIDVLRAGFGGHGPAQVESAKFIRPVLPEQPLTLRLTLTAGSKRARFRIETRVACVALGMLRYPVEVNLSAVIR